MDTIVGAPPPQHGVEDFLTRQNASAVQKKVARPKAPRRSLTGLAIAVGAGIVAGVLTVVVIERVRGVQEAPVAAATPDALAIGPAEVTSSPPAAAPKAAATATAPAKAPVKTTVAAAVKVPPATAAKAAVPSAPSPSAKKAKRAQRATPPTTTMTFGDELPAAITPPPTTPTDPDAPLPH